MTAKENNLKNLILRAEILGKTNWLHAVHLLEKAAEDYPRERSVYLTLGDVYMRHKNYEQAIDSFQKALTIDPKDEHLLFIIGNCYLSLSDFRMALYYYEQVSSDTPELSYNKALAYAYTNEHDLCIHQLKDLIQRVNENANIYYFLIEEYLRAHKYNDAIKLLNDMEARFGVQRYQQILKGFVWSFRKVWLKSFMAFKTADELSFIINPEHLHTFAQAGWQIGQLDKAIELLNRAIRINPTTSVYHEDLIRVFIQKNDYAAAREALEDAKNKLGNENPVLLMLREKLDRLLFNDDYIAVDDDSGDNDSNRD